MEASFEQAAPRSDLISNALRIAVEPTQLSRLPLVINRRPALFSQGCGGGEQFRYVGAASGDDGIRALTARFPS